jgi:IS30 family transposase
MATGSRSTNMGAGCGRVGVVICKAGICRFRSARRSAVARAAGESVRCIARRLGRSASTVSRELARNADRRGEYRATTAHALAWERACRPKPAKLRVNAQLREIVQRDLERKYSPEQIAGAPAAGVSR